MSLFHAVAFVDHRSAQVLQFASDQVQMRRVHQHFKFTHPHHSGVRSEHEYLGQVCDALDGIPEVLVVGGHTALADFRRYVDKHRPQIAAHIVGFEVADNPTQDQLIALAKAYFLKYDQLISTAKPD